MRITIVVALTLAAATTWNVFAGEDAATQRSGSSGAGDKADSQEGLVRRGEYLVHHVAMCIYCHTPRDENGVIDDQQLLRGAPVPLESPFVNQTWAVEAPDIAGLPGGWSEQDLVRFLQTGKRPRGVAPELPMPPFRMTKQDATAVTAYLKSLE